MPYWEVPGVGRYAQYKFRPILTRANGDYIVSIAQDATWRMWLEAMHWPEDKPAFAYFPAAAGGNGEFVESFTVKEGDHLTLTSGASNNQTVGIIFKFTSGSEWTQSFKLVENVFKSQIGDYGQAMAKSVAVEGTDGNGQPFSFNAVTIE